jgi:malate dehydrogenase (oxaloacetate-decarboxylating)(NADP+)
MVKSGIDLKEARSKCFFVDTGGVVCSQRENLAAHKLDYAHDIPFAPTLIEAIKSIRPTILIGVSGQPGKFDQEVLETMTELNEQPIIFALSNPTSKSECTAKDAYLYTQGKAIFASGSPFSPVEVLNKTFFTGQGNNVYIFPGIGLGVSFAKATLVSDSMFLAAAKVVSDCVTTEELEQGLIYPSMERIREVSCKIAVEVAKLAVEESLSSMILPEDLYEAVWDFMFTPEYPTYY